MHTLVHQANGGLTTSIHLYHQCKNNREACWGKEKWWKAVNANNTPNRRIFDDAVIDWTSNPYWIRYVQRVAKRRLWSIKYELFLIPRINKKSWIHIINFFFAKYRAKPLIQLKPGQKKAKNLINICTLLGRVTFLLCNSEIQKLRRPTLKKTNAIVLPAAVTSFAMNFWNIFLVSTILMSHAYLIRSKKSSKREEAIAVVITSLVTNTGESKRLATVPTNRANKIC